MKIRIFEKGRVVESSLTLKFNACCDKQTFVFNISKHQNLKNSDKISNLLKICK